MIGWSIAWAGGIKGVCIRAHRHIYNLNIPFLIRVAALRDCVFSMNSSIAGVASSEAIARMLINSNHLFRGEINRGARDNRLCLSAKYRK